MPIYPRTYKHWEGPLGGGWARLTAFARAGAAVAWRNKWLRRVLFFSFAPLAVFAIGFYAFGAIFQPGNFMGEAMRAGLGPRFTDLFEREVATRTAVWSVMLYMYLNALQTFLVFLVVAFVGPGLIAADLRHHAHEIYFARPVQWSDYILGKLSVIAVLVAAVTVVPAGILYAESILVSPTLDALWHTWHMPLRLVAIWLAWSLAMGLPVLALSALTGSTRLATFAWVLIWFGSELISTAIVLASGLGQHMRGMSGDQTEFLSHWGHAFSLHDNLLALARGLLGVDGAVRPLRQALPQDVGRILEGQGGHSPWIAAAVLGGVALGSLAVLRWRVRPEGAA